MTQHEYEHREWLRTDREILGWTQKHLAEQIGVAPNTVARWERGELPISKLAQVAIQGVFRRAFGGAQEDEQPRASPIDSDRLRQLIQLCHPDKHHGSKSATNVTAWLNGLRN